MRSLELVPVFGFTAFVAILAANVFFLKRKNIPVVSSPEKKEKKKFIVYPVFILVFGMIVLEIFRPVLGNSFRILPDVFIRPLSAGMYFQMAGLIVCLLSLLLLQVTFLHFGSSFRFGMNKSNSPKLVTSGIFTITRNPFFVSIELFFAALALFFTSLFFIGVFFLSAVSIHFFILKEEKFLADIFGDAYKTYSKKTRRYL